MRIIPKRTKVSTEFFRGASIADILVGFFGVLVMFFVFISSLPGRLWIDLGLLFFFALLLVRIDEEPNYMFLLQLLRHFSHERRFRLMDPGEPTTKKERKSREKAAKKKRKAEEKKRKAAEKLQKAAKKKAQKKQPKGKKKAQKEDGQKPSSSAHPETEDEQELFDLPEDGTAEQTPEGGEASEAEDHSDDDAELDLEQMRALAEGTLKKEEDLDKAPMTRRDRRLAQKAAKRAKKQKKKAKKAEDKFLKSRKVSEEEKAPIRERRQKEAEERYFQFKVAEQKKNRRDIHKMTMVSEINGGFICYSGEYYGAAIEIPAVEFRFFSPNRRSNAIDTALGGVVRSVGARYAANLVKIERPMVLDDHIQSEYGKIEALKRSYERGVFSEDELKSRVEVIYDRISALEERNLEDKVLVPHFYLVLFDSDKRQLENQVQSAMIALRQGEMEPRRLNDKELAVFLRYTNSVDFDEREIEDTDPADYARFVLPQSLELKMRTAEVNSVITHNFRVLNYPLIVDDAWGAQLFDIPGTKVVMKFSQMDRDKSIRAIDRSISELNSQLAATEVSSRIIELQTHIDTLSELLVMLQNNNENLLAMNMYITGYDIAATRDNKLLVPQPPPSVLPRITGMKKDIKRSFTEKGFRLTDMTCQQFEAFVATQVNGYDPFMKKARGVPGSTLAGVFPWIYANLSDDRGLNLGSSDGVPAFVDFFRRDSERVNSNMVIVGKSGGGKSYATKSILANLAADDAKIFVLDPENEYTELANNLKGKFINVANASHGRINPFHIITSLEDDEATDGEETSSYAAHLQFLEEFFRQILPEIDGDAMEYLNNLINRVYSQKGIDQYTNLTSLRPEDYPIFDDLYDCILEEFQRTKSDYLKSNLRVLMNYIAKFSTGGRNAGIWNGPSTLSTAENFIVFNFQTLLANRNNTVANAQMLLVLKYLDNEIIKNREYNLKYGANRKIIVVIDEAHVFIDVKYPLALDFMFQLAKRIRKYNGMQIVITQNIKDFVGSEELARKSTAIINACQYSFIFSLAPNDMHDLCTLYEKAGGINESEQEQIISAPRGQAFVVTGPTSRTSLRVETPAAIEDMFSNPIYATHYFGSEEGEAAWEALVGESREARAEWEQNQPYAALPPAVEEENLPSFRDVGVDLVELEEEEILLVDDTPAVAESLPKHMKAQAVEEIADQPEPDGVFSPQALQRYGFEALLSEIRRTVRQEVENELGSRPELEPAMAASVPPTSVPPAAPPEPTWETQPAQTDWLTSAPQQEQVETEDWFTPTSDEEDWFNPSASQDNMFEDLFSSYQQEWEKEVQTENSGDSLDDQPEEDLFQQSEEPTQEEQLQPEDEPLEEEPQEEETPLVFEVTLDQLIAMVS